MFKKALIKFAKAAAIIVVIGIVIVTLKYINMSKSDIRVVSNNELEKEIKNEELVKLQGQGIKKVAENDNLALSVDFTDGNIEVLNKKDEYVWRSKPSKEEFARENSNDLWKGNINSPIIFDYIDDYASMDTKIGNVNNQGTQISVYQLENGARVYFDFKKSGIKMAYDLRLGKDNLDVSIPSYLIYEPGVYYLSNDMGLKIIDKNKTILLTDFCVLPFFGASRSDRNEKGYLMLPDGPGALIRFENNKGLNSQFVGSVYGTDLSYLNKYDSTIMNEMKKYKVLFPVYGIVRDSNSLLAIIHKGESNADIIGIPANVQTGFNVAYARYNYRKKYKVITSTDNGNGYFRYSNLVIKDIRAIRYYFGCGSRADYVGMAHTYRDYLMETKGITKKETTGEEAPLQLSIYGGTMKPNFIGRSFITMTSFKQAEDMVNFFKNNDVKNVEITYEGWASRGEAAMYPYRFPAEGKLGGNSGLTDFVKYAHGSGYKVYLEDDNMTAASRRGISLRRDTIYNIQGNPLDYNGFFLNISASLRFLDKSMTQYKKYGIDGLEEKGIGRFVTSDFNRNNIMSRSDMKDNYAGILDKERSQFNGIRIPGGMAFTLSDKTTVVDMAMDGSYLTVLDETVPFYEIALHGIVDYVFGEYNLFSEPDLQMLKAVEYGGNVDFIVTAKPTELLKDVRENRLYSTEFSKWHDEILSQYKRISSVLNKTRGQYITGYEKVSPDVAAVTYENGIKVVCNYADEAYDYEGSTVNPRDFLLIEGK